MTRSHFAVIALAFLLSLPALAGAQTRLTPLNAGGLQSELDQLTGRVILINFWATWCRPCLDEIPTLVALETQLQAKGFSLVAVSLDEADRDDADIRSFMEERFPGFSSYRSTERNKDTIVSVIDSAWNEILPTTYLLARDGSVVRRIQGSLTSEEFEREIAQLLN